MKRIFYLMCCAAMMIVSINARAQYKVELSSDPVETYYCAGMTFDAVDVASALGIDTLTLHSLISETGSVFLHTQDGKTNAYNGNAGENVFWMTSQAVPQAYGVDGTCWYAGISYNVESLKEGTEEVVPANVSVDLGQMPGVFSKIYENTVLSATLSIDHGEKSVSFDISLTINAAVKIEMPEPVKDIKGLTVVKEYDVTLPFFVGKEYENKTVSQTLEGIYDALGVESSVLDAKIVDCTFTRLVDTYKENEDATPVYTLSNSLEAPEVAAGGGWFGRYYNDDESSESMVFVGNAPKAWGTSYNTYYVQSIRLADGDFSFITGQYPGTLKEGDKDEVDLYIVYGDKAALVRLTSDVTVPPVVPFEEMTMAGESLVEISANVDDSYATKSLNVDMSAVCEALGCAAVDITDVFAFAAEGQISNNHTESSGGFYFAENGYIDTWGGNATFFIAVASLPNGSFSIGQRSGKYTGIEEPKTVETDIVLTYADKYYKVHVAYTIKPVAQIETEPTMKSVEVINKQIVPNVVAYNGKDKMTLDLDYIESLIGTRDFKLYSDTVNVDPVTGEEKCGWSDKYTCTPAPGFWFDSKEYVIDGVNKVASANWGADCAFGFTYSGGVITWYEIPDARKVGDAYSANIYLVNEETLDYIQYVVNVSYVEEVTPEPEVVATEDVIVYVDESSKDYFVGEIDMPTVFGLLGIEDVNTIPEELNVVVCKSPTMAVVAGIGEEFAFDSKGYSTASAEENGAFLVSVGIKDDKLVVLADFINANNKQMDAVSYIGLEYKGKRVMLNVSYTDNMESVGIDATKVVVGEGAAYTVSGIRRNTGEKGIAIVKMADGSVKKISK